MRKIVLLLVIVLSIFLVVGCSKKDEAEDLDGGGGVATDTVTNDTETTYSDTAEKTSVALSQGRIIEARNGVALTPVNANISIGALVVTQDEIPEVYDEALSQSEKDGFEFVTQPVDITVEVDDEAGLEKYYEDGGAFEVAFDISEVVDTDELVALHYDEEGYEIIEGEVNEEAGTYVIEANSFSPYVIGVKSATIKRWNKTDNTYMEVNKVYDFESLDNTFSVNDLYVNFGKRTYWGTIADPSNSGMGQVLYCAAIENEAPTGNVTGYEKKMKSILEFAYENDKADVESFKVAFDMYMDVSGKMGYVNEDFLTLQMRLTPFSKWQTVTPVGEKYKYLVTSKGDWAHVEYDISDIDTLVTWTGATTPWGFHEFKSVYFRVLFKSGMDAGPDTSDGSMKGAYIDNLVLDVVYESDENEAISDTLSQAEDFYNGKSDFFDRKPEEWMVELFDMSLEEVIAVAGQPSNEFDIQGSSIYYEFDGFAVIYYIDVPKPHTVAINHPGLLFENILLGGKGEQLDVVKPDYEHSTNPYFENIGFYSYDYMDEYRQTFAVETTGEGDKKVTTVTGMDLVKEKSNSMFTYEPKKDILDDVAYYMTVPYGELVAGKHGEVEDITKLYGGDTSVYVNGYEIAYSGNESDDMLPIAVYYEGLNSYFGMYRWIRSSQIRGHLDREGMTIVAENDDHAKQFSMNPSFEWVVEGPEGRFYLYFEKAHNDFFEDYVLKAVGFRNEVQTDMAVEERFDLEDFIMNALYTMSPSDIKKTLNGVTEEEGGMVNYLIYGDLTFSASPNDIVDVSYTGSDTLYGARLGMTIEEARALGPIGEDAFGEDYLFLYYNVGQSDGEMKLIFSKNSNGKLVATAMIFYSKSFIQNYYSVDDEAAGI